MMRPDDPFDRVEQWFNQFPFGSSVAGLSELRNDVHVRDDGEEFVVTAELPGYEEDGIDISLDGRSLTITAEDDNMSRWRHGVRLPTAVEHSNASATYNNGLLTITLPKADGTGGTTISIE